MPKSAFDVELLEGQDDPSAADHDRRAVHDAGLSEDARGAVKLAVRDAVDLLVEEKGLTADEAYLLITVKGDIEICQVVDPLMTVRVAMDREFYEEPGTALRKEAA